MKLQQLLSFVRKACEDFDMISENDKIAVGLSGGKDSVTMLIALKNLQRFYPKRFELSAVSVSLGFERTDFSSMRRLCDELEVPLNIVETDIGKIIFDDRREKNPCSLCAKMRKGALNDAVKAAGFNKVAYAHNKNDTIETFFMSLFFESRVYTFSPKMFLDRKELYLIRPMIYVPECEIISFVKKNEYDIVKNPCPANGYTKRQEIKEFIALQNKVYPGFDDKIFGAIKRSEIPQWK